jgi:putative transcriptional regulator
MPLMVDILRSKNLASKFQILLEIASNQPIIPQKEIAQKLAITSQAVSEYIKELISDGWLSSSGRSRYKVTKEGVDWILRMLRQLHAYTSFVDKIVADIYVTTAIAVTDLNFGQSVSLYMEDGLLFASDIVSDEGAHGITISGVKKGEDVGISSIEGLIDLGVGKAMIFAIPGVREGGSRNTAIALLKKEMSRYKLVGAIGIESIVVLKRAGINPDYIFGVKEAITEAACHGLVIAVVCVDYAISALIESLRKNSIDYEIIDLIEDKHFINL